MQPSDEGRQGPPPKLDRLPPPAFAPGSRRGAVARPKEEAEAIPSLEEALPAGAFISPDEPIRRIPGDVPDDAFISPDEPIRHRDPLPGKPAFRPQGEVMGIGARSSNYYQSVATLATDVRDVGQMAQVLEELAARLKEDGAAALIAEPGISTFEAAVRGYLAGYLTRTRDEG